MTERIKAMKRKIVTAFMMAALGSSLVFSQAAMAADTTAKTETSEDADLKTIGEKPEEEQKNLTNKDLTGVTGKNEKD